MHLDNFLVIFLISNSLNENAKSDYVSDAQANVINKLPDSILNTWKGIQAAVNLTDSAVKRSIDKVFLANNKSKENIKSLGLVKALAAVNNYISFISNTTSSIDALYNIVEHVGESLSNLNKSNSDTNGSDKQSVQNELSQNTTAIIQPMNLEESITSRKNQTEIINLYNKTLTSSRLGDLGSVELPSNSVIRDIVNRFRSRPIYLTASKAIHKATGGNGFVAESLPVPLTKTSESYSPPTRVANRNLRVLDRSQKQSRKNNLFNRASKRLQLSNIVNNIKNKSNAALKAGIVASSSIPVEEIPIEEIYSVGKLIYDSRVVPYLADRITPGEANLNNRRPTSLKSDPSVGQPEVICNNLGMTCCIPQAVISFRKTNRPKLNGSLEPHCEAIYVPKLNQFCVTALYEGESSCDTTLLDALDFVIYQNRFLSAGLKSNNALCSCQIFKNNSSQDGVRTVRGEAIWEYSINSIKSENENSQQNQFSDILLYHKDKILEFAKTVQNSVEDELLESSDVAHVEGELLSSNAESLSQSLEPSQTLFNFSHEYLNNENSPIADDVDSTESKESTVVYKFAQMLSNIISNM